MFLQFTTLCINQLYVSNSSIVIGWLFFRTAKFGCRELGPETWVHRNSPGRVRIYSSYFVSAIVFGQLNILFYNLFFFFSISMLSSSGNNNRRTNPQCDNTPRTYGEAFNDTLILCCYDDMCNGHDQKRFHPNLTADIDGKSLRSR